MKSMAAYYAFIALNSQQQDADRRQAQLRAARPAGPSLIARVRALVGPVRRSGPATHAA